MTIREKLKQLDDRVNKLMCCLFGNSTTSLAAIATMIQDVSAGTHSYPHGLNGAPLVVITYEGDNQPINFADITFDATNITLYSDEDLTGIRFVMIKPI